jgi:glycosyltransferase involved in cell wall biosynthesis
VSQGGGAELSTVLVLPAWYPTAERPLNGVFVRDHARAAAAQGHRVIVVVDQGPQAGVKGLFSLAEERDHDLRVIRLAYRPRTGRVAFLCGILAVARRLAREGEPVDVLHAHVHRMGWVATLAGGLLRRPVVITEHSSEWPRGLMSRAALRRARIAFRRAALVCPVSDELQQAIERHGVPARYRVVPNAVDTSLFHPPEQPSESALSRLLNVALHEEIKGVDFLIRAFASLVQERPELTLELIGEGPLTPHLRQTAAELGLGGRVRFTGLAAAPQVAEALRSADVFVLPSLSENLPVALLEALCTGLPVVATRVGGVEAALNGDGELVEPGDAAALARAIETVLDGSARFDSADIARRAADRWSIEAVGRTWDEIYRSL